MKKLLVLLPLLISCSFNKPTEYEYSNAKIFAEEIISQNQDNFILESYSNESGKGLILLKDKILAMSNFKPELYAQKIGDDIGYSSISLNEEGDGFIVWLNNDSYKKSTINELHVSTIISYKYDSEKIYSSDDIYTYPPIVKIDSKGNGFISWDKEKENKYISIKDFKLNDKIEVQNVDYKFFLSSIDSNDTSKINHIDLTVLKEEYADIKFISDKYVDSILAYKQPRRFIFTTVKDGKLNFPAYEYKKELFENMARYSSLRVNNHTKKYFESEGIGVAMSNNNKSIFSGKVTSDSGVGLKTRITNELYNGELKNTNININKSGDGIILWIEKQKNKIFLRYTLVRKYQAQSAYNRSPEDEWNQVQAF